MRQIAVYGKGGIGKSTISANISAALAENNKKVLQIGCDPKHDSTRLLMGGREITTVLDYIKETLPEDYRLSDILFNGYKGVSCVEAGGPEPGVGCAGRGILTTFDLLQKLGVFNNNYDAVIYDVLGDVVCGGFAVPIRHEYADVVYIVTSGEYMSIYAANNILKGLKNFDGSLKRVGGIIFNRRGIENEDERIKNFSNAVKLPVCEEFPRDNVFALAEKNGFTVIENFNDNYISKKFKKLAAHIINNSELFEADPLTDSQLEEVVLHKKNRYCDVDTSKEKNTLQNKEEKNEEENNPARYLSKDVLMKEPLHGCAFNGAVNTAVQMEDAVTVAHGPRSCAHISYQTITSIGKKSFFERGILIPVQISPALISSEMNEGVMVFGGLEELKEKIYNLKKYKPAAIFVVTTCPSGIIGEDINALQNMDMDGIPVIPINTDGNITGDYLQGIIISYIEIAKRLIKRNVKKEDDTVNLVAEKPIASSTDKNYNIIKKLLNELGIKINCRFLCNSSVKDVSNFLKAKVNILAYEDYMGRTIKQFLENEYKADFIKRPFPIGFNQTRNWLTEIADVFNKSAETNGIVDKYKRSYHDEIKKIKPLLENKKLMIITYNHDIDWLIETILDLNMKITKVCILNYSQDNLFRTDFKGDFEIEENYDPEKRKSDIEKLKPDLVLSNYTSSALGGSVCTDTIPLCPDVGFNSGLEIAKRWAGLISLDLKEGWKKDEALFRKYYA